MRDQARRRRNYCLGRSSLITERILDTSCADTSSISWIKRMCSTALIINSPSSSSCKTEWHPGTTEAHSKTLVIYTSQYKWPRHPPFAESTKM